MSEPHHVEAMLDAPEDVETPAARYGHFMLTRRGLVVDESDGLPPYEEWESVGHVLAGMEQGLAFIIGDWLRYGEHYKEMASQVIDARHWKPETVRNYVWLAEKVPMENRFTDRGLFVKHHVAVARLHPQQQRKWLYRAAIGDGAGERWTVSRLQQEIKADAEQKGQLVETSWGVNVTCTSRAQRDNLQKNLELEGLACKPWESRGIRETMN